LECETATARDYSMTIKESNTEDRGSKEWCKVKATVHQTEPSSHNLCHEHTQSFRECRGNFPHVPTKSSHHPLDPKVHRARPYMANRTHHLFSCQMTVPSISKWRQLVAYIVLMWVLLFVGNCSCL
jgi:hypothetical protein